MAIQKLELSRKVTLPEQVVKAFVRLGDSQRGAPEHAMLKVQEIMGGGVLNPVVEHVGDLTHRMTHMLEWGTANTGYEIVKDKVHKCLRWLTHGYGFTREMEANIQNNAAYRKVDPIALELKINAALKAYANEHRKLKVYNKAQWLAREAAICLGERRFNASVSCLESLQTMLKSEEIWNEQCLAYRLDSAGNVMEFDG